MVSCKNRRTDCPSRLEWIIMGLTTGNTYTPQQGNTKQGTQGNQAVQTLSGMGQIANPIQGYNQASNAQQQAIAAQPAYLNQQAQGLYNQAQLPQLTNQMGLTYDTFSKMLAQDPAGQRFLDPNYSSQQASNSFALPN